MVWYLDSVIFGNPDFFLGGGHIYTLGGLLKSIALGVKVEVPNCIIAAEAFPQKDLPVSKILDPGSNSMGTQRRCLDPQLFPGEGGIQAQKNVPEKLWSRK